MLLAVWILSSHKVKLSPVCFDAPPRLGKQSLAQTYRGRVCINARAYSEETDVISPSRSCLQWTLEWNTSLRVLHAAQCKTAYLITVQPKGQSSEQTHGMIDVIMFHLWLSPARPTPSDLQSFPVMLAFVCHTCRSSWCYTDGRLKNNVASHAFLLHLSAGKQRLVQTLHLALTQARKHSHLNIISLH